MPSQRPARKRQAAARTAELSAGRSLLWEHDVSRSAGAGDAMHAAEGNSIARRGVLGIDEAGRGSWAGPVVAAAAYLLPEAYEDESLLAFAVQIDDSKKLTPARRELVFEQLCLWQASGLIRIAAGRAEVEEIEAHNIIGATAIAMQRAVAALSLPGALPCGAGVKIGGKRPAVPAASRPAQAARTAAVAAQPQQTELLWQDAHQQPPHNLACDLAELQANRTDAAAGNAVSLPTSLSPADVVFAIQQTQPAEALPSVGWTPPHVWLDGLPMTGRVPWAHEGIVSGDALSLAIAMASVFAKVTRDRLLCRLAEAFPHYGWEQNCGYGTPVHQAALREHGRCCHHRPRFLLKQGL